MICSELISCAYLKPKLRRLTTPGSDLYALAILSFSSELNTIKLNRKASSFRIKSFLYFAKYSSNSVCEGEKEKSFKAFALNKATANSFLFCSIIDLNSASSVKPSSTAT